MVDDKGLEIEWPYWPFNPERLISGQAGKIKIKQGWLPPALFAACRTYFVELSVINVMLFPHCLQLAGQVRAE